MSSSPMQEPPNKPWAARRTNDIVVVVGQEEFDENSQMLRYCSEYFDGAFRSGMRESQTGRFEFLDRDPEEWKLIRSLFEPFDPHRDAKITSNNVFTIVSWFNELLVPGGIYKCDHFVLENVLPECLPPAATVSPNDSSFWSFVSTKMASDLVDIFSKSVEFNLPQSKAKCCALIRDMLQEAHHYRLLDSGLLEKICEIVGSYEECHEEFWPLLEALLPQQTKIADRAHQNVLLSTGLLPVIIRNSVELKLMRQAYGNPFQVSSYANNSLRNDWY